MMDSIAKTSGGPGGIGCRENYKFVKCNDASLASVNCVILQLSSQRLFCGQLNTACTSLGPVVSPMLASNVKLSEPSHCAPTLVAHPCPASGKSGVMGIDA
jgi:hypothetical protein